MTGRSSWLSALVWISFAAGAAAQDSVVYTVARESRLDVHTGRAGLLGTLGHEHLIRARAFHGTIVHVSTSAERSSVRITVLTDSLEVLTDAKPSDVAKMRRAMREQTLRVDRFPEITFTSRRVEQLGAGEVGGRSPGTTLRISGDFTMAGRTQPVTVEMSIQVARDTLRASGQFSVKQTDFGIAPYSTALGTVKVADRVRFDLEVTAVSASQ